MLKSTGWSKKNVILQPGKNNLKYFEIKYLIEEKAQVFREELLEKFKEQYQICIIYINFKNFEKRVCD